jgi:hypothetical protein
LQGDLDPDVSEKLRKTIGTKSDDMNEYLRCFTHAVVTLPEFNLA